MMPILVTAVHPNGFPEELFWLQKAVALGRKKKNEDKRNAISDQPRHGFPLFPQLTSALPWISPSPGILFFSHFHRNSQSSGNDREIHPDRRSHVGDVKTFYTEFLELTE